MNRHLKIKQVSKENFNKIMPMIIELLEDKLIQKRGNGFGQDIVYHVDALAVIQFDFSEG